MAFASTPTLLSLDRYAAIMGLNPCHFSGADGGQTGVMPVWSNCNSIWFQHSWQYNSQVSREDVANLIYQAENAIANVLGFYPAPYWIESEEVHLDSYYRKGWVDTGYGLYTRKSGMTNFSQVVAVGKRTTLLVSTPTISYSDADGDGLNETATITTTISQDAVDKIADLSDPSGCLTHLSRYMSNDAYWFKFYYPGKSGWQQYEIRPPRTLTLTGTSLTATFYTWQLILESKLNVFPTVGGAPTAVPIDDATNLLSTLEVRMEYPDYSLPQATLVWDKLENCADCNNESGCGSCRQTSQDACCAIQSGQDGFVQSYPASYNATDNKWEATTQTLERGPNKLFVHYATGLLSNEFCRGLSSDPLSQDLAEAIAWLATARMEVPLCGCNHLNGKADYYRQDLTLQSSEGNFIVVSPLVLQSPFGTRRGEVMAWEKVSRLMRDKRADFAVI